MHGSFVLLKKLGWACLPHKRLGLAGPLQGLPVTILIWLPEDQRGSPGYQTLPCWSSSLSCMLTGSCWPGLSLPCHHPFLICTLTPSTPSGHCQPKLFLTLGQARGRETKRWCSGSSSLVCFSQTCCRCREVGSWEVQKPTAMAQRATGQAGHLNTGLSCIMRQCRRYVLCPWGQQLSRSKPLSLPGDTAQHGTAWHGPAQTSMARPGMAQPRPAQPRPA